MFQQVENLKERISVQSQQLNRQCELQEQATVRARALQDEKVMLESTLHKIESDLRAAEVSREGLRHDKSTVSCCHILK